MAFLRMSKKDRAFFTSIGAIKGKPKSYSLVYKTGGKIRETILPETTYALCVYKDNEIKGYPQYQRGTLVINPNY